MYRLLTRVAVRSGKTERWEAMNLVESQYEINMRSDIFRWRTKETEPIMIQIFLYWNQINTISYNIRSGLTFLNIYISLGNQI